jgi:hypothetical protein
MFMLTLWCDAGLSYDTIETSLKDAFLQHDDVIQGLYVNINTLINYYTSLSLFKILVQFSSTCAHAR